MERRHVSLSFLFAILKQYDGSVQLSLSCKGDT